jgi:hypothetical protein
MRKKYHGTVRTGGRAVYEGWYQTRGKAVIDLKRKARETVLNSFEENTHVDYTLSLGSLVVTSGRIPTRKMHHRRPPAFPCSGYGVLPLCGTRIC